MNRPALGSFPGADWAETIQKGLLTVAPKGVPHLFTQVRPPLSLCVESRF